MKKSYFFLTGINPDDSNGPANWSFDKWMTLFSAFTLLAAFFYFLYAAALFASSDGEQITCILRLLTGHLCPGCNATHSLVHFFSGHLLQSLCTNAFVTVVLFTLLIYTIMNALHYLSKAKLPGLRFHIWYMGVYVAVLFVNWICMNLF